MNNLVRLNTAQVKPAAEVAMRALCNSPLIIYFYPDDSSRMRKAVLSFQFLIRYGVLYGEVYATSEHLEGLAVWFPLGRVDMSIWEVIRSGGIPVLLKSIDVWHRLLSYNQHDAAMHGHHAPVKHWYLMLIAVDPDFQGKGYGSKLMRPLLARIDREQLPCYLETHTEKNVSLYQHYGFKVVEERVIPGSQVNQRAMLREPEGVI